MNLLPSSHENFLSTVGTPPAFIPASDGSDTQMKQAAPNKILHDLLEEQQALTVVSRFAQKHAHQGSHEARYRDLIPLSEPKPGEQYAFEVNLDKCSGCKACVAACHSLNGLEEDESWRSVGLLVNDDTAAPIQQTVTTACHHCADPACLNGCPVLAYEKDPRTGIVRHLDDQCIGCQYCVMKCPYEVPRYSSRLGIVRKCDMCGDRLRAGEAPACVQSCPTEAIRITTVSSADLLETHRGSPENRFLPATPAPGYTVPSTVYRSLTMLPREIRAADELALHPAPPHWPLIWMLLLTQASAGLFWMQSLVLLTGSWPNNSRLLVLSAALPGFAGLAASVLHLGRPLHAWRAFLGVGRSWLSREIIGFSAFALAMMLLVLVEVLPGFFPSLAGSNTASHLPSVLAIPAIVCSVMVYHDTRREFWNWKRTMPQFIGTATLLGSAAGLILLPDHKQPILLVLCLSSVFKAAAMLSLLVPLSTWGSSPLKRSALLLTQQLGVVMSLRLAALAPGIVAPAIWIMLERLPTPASAGILLLVLFLGEVAERFLFFRAVAQPKMPGGLP